MAIVTRIRNTILASTAVTAVAAMLLLFGAGSASAAPSGGYGTFAAAGAANAYTGTITLPIGFPAVTYTSDSRALGGAQVSSGASTWIPTGTLFGSEFGSSQGKPYISFGPKSNDATSPSTTTYTFATATPVGGWGMVLGDIDAERLVISGTDATGAAIPAAQLGLTTFNYCVTTSGPTSCAAGSPVPVATTSAASISVEDPLCPVQGAFCNTSGEAASLIPTVVVKTLTVVSNWKQGLPAYQTWFATTAHSISGTVTTDFPVTTPISTQLVTPDGTVAATAPVSAGGAFSFPVVAGRADYTVRADPATIPTGANPGAIPVDASAADVSSLIVAVTRAGVAAPPATPPVAAPTAPGLGDPAAPTLAFSGYNAWPLAASGFVLVAAGVALLSKRGRSRHG